MENTSNQNLQLFRLIQRLDRAISEVQGSVSSNGPIIVKWDIKRWRSYVDAYEQYVNTLAVLGSASNQPANSGNTGNQATPVELDLGEVAPKEFPITAAPAVVLVNNESVGEIRDTLLAIRNSTAVSQSAAYPYGLHPDDKQRLLDAFNVIRSTIDYAETVEPLDYVETSPRSNIPVTGNLTRP